ncbi:MAG: hypothetical protein ACK4K9_06800 [Bacteroidia bacterium]
MKSLSLKIITGIAVCMLFMNVQCPDNNFEMYTQYLPVFMTREELEKSIAFIDTVDLKNPAKIYVKGNYLFISEAYKGVHIIDNTDERNPKTKGYIRVAGCMDMAVKGNTLYVDNATDLLAFDISTPESPVLANRLKDVFPEPVPPDFGLIPTEFAKENRPAGLILVEWRKKDYTQYTK